MDPVVGTIIVALITAAISGTALVRSTKTNATTSSIQTLVTAQQAALTRLDGQVAAKDSIIDDLREDLDKCHAERLALSREVERQGTALAQAERAIERQASAIEVLRGKIDDP